MLIQHKGLDDAHVVVDSESVGGNLIEEPGLVAGHVGLAMRVAHTGCEAVKKVSRAWQVEVRQSDERLLEMDHEIALRLVEETWVWVGVHHSCPVAILIFSLHVEVI